LEISQRFANLGAMQTTQSSTAGERTQAGRYQVIYVVTMEDETGFYYRSDRDAWTTEHDDALAFESDAAASEVAKGFSYPVGVLCSARRGPVRFVQQGESKAERKADLASSHALELVATLRELHDAIDEFGSVPCEEAGKTDRWGRAYARKQDARKRAHCLLLNVEAWT
jgi:hypothetical protein